MINKLIGLPELASEHGLLIDNMLELLHWVIAALLVGWLCFYIYCLIRFRKTTGEVVFECWPRFSDVTRPDAKQFPGWPVTVKP